MKAPLFHDGDGRCRRRDRRFGRGRCVDRPPAGARRQVDPGPGSRSALEPFRCGREVAQRQLRAAHRSDFQGPCPQSKFATAPLCFPANEHVGLTGPMPAALSWLHQGGRRHDLALGRLVLAPSAGRLQMQSAYGVCRDWPISYEDVEPYPCRAEEAMGVSGPNNPTQQPPRNGSRRG